MNATKELLWVEIKLFLREPVAVFFTLIFPFLPLMVFGTLFGSIEIMPGLRVIDVYVPALIAMVTAFLGLMSIPIALSQYREQGVLKRFRASPLPLASVLAAHVALQFLLLCVVSVLITWLADLVFGLAVDFGNLPAVLSILVLGSLAMFTLGFALVGVLESPRTTQAVGSVLFFMMLFTSGAAIPRRQFPPWLKEITDYVPLSHLVDVLTAAWIGEPLSGHLVSFAVLAALAVLSFAVAKLTFRWET